MLDRAAAISAARQVLEAAPTVDVEGMREPVIDIGRLVDTVLAAANPDALVVPVYDVTLAQSARYRLEQDDGSTRGAQMAVTAQHGAVLITVSRAGEVIVAGLVNSDAMWQLGLACCSAASAVKDARERRGA